MKLEKLSQYILDYRDDLYSGKTTWSDLGTDVGFYASFVQKKFNLGSFVPAKFIDDKWIYLEEPRREYYDSMTGWNCPEDAENYENKLIEYNEACEEVLFKDFQFSSENTVRNKDGLYIYLDILQFMQEHSNGLGGGDIGGNTLEHLALCELNLELR